MEAITVSCIVRKPPVLVWECWTRPEHITKWAFASDDWEAPEAENDVRRGGKFRIRMAAKDRSASFDFTGTYTEVIENKLIEYDMEDGRHVKIEFKPVEARVKVTETFDPETENPREMQQNGWQSILDNFRKYAEALS